MARHIFNQRTSVLITTLRQRDMDAVCWHVTESRGPEPDPLRVSPQKAPENTQRLQALANTCDRRTSSQNGLGGGSET
jgi:hypothetical protein